MSEGMNYDELKELLKYIEDNHSWKNMHEIHHAHPKNCPKMIKYVRFSFDTRDCDIWSVTFDNISGSKEHEITFRTENGYNLKDKIYKWLKESD